MSVRISQETLEVVLAPAANVRVSQEVVEVVLPQVPPAGTDSWTVRAFPLVRWSADTDDPHHPRGTWEVRCRPRIEWDGLEYDPVNRFFVNCEPKVEWVTGPGTASTECISGDGVVPPPDEPPAESTEQNYVF